jgi:small-conductance mechanosensitive channel
MKRILFFLVFTLTLFHSFALISKETKYDVNLQSNTKKMEEISKDLSSNKNLSTKQYNHLRSKITEVIDSLNEQKVQISDQMTHSTSDEKEKLEPILEKLNDTGIVANNILKTIDKKEIQSTLMKYVVLELPLYNIATLQTAYQDGIYLIKDISTQLHQTRSNVVKSWLVFPFYIYWILWLLLGIAAIPMAKAYRKKVINAEMKSIYLKKIRIFVTYVITGSLIPVLFISGFFFLNLLTDSFAFPFDKVLGIYLVIVFAWIALQATPALIYPKNFSWSLVKVDIDTACSLSRRISLFLVLLGLRLWLNEINSPIELTQYLELGIQIFLSVQAFFIIYVTNFRKSIKCLIVFLAAVDPILIFIGYGPLADLIFNGTLLTIIIYLGFKGISYSFKKMLVYLFKESDTIFTDSGRSHKTSELIIYWISVFFNVILFLISLYGVLLSWGIDRTYLNAFVSRALFGFTVGTHTISFINLFSSVAIFLLLVLLTKYMQRVLAKHVFPYTKFDSGLKHTLRTTVGYIGFTVAVVMSIRTLGFNLSSLIYILGGLSVGIGLALQPIVTNFISGLIMLVERPIKIGDFIELGGEMGIVKNINVRTTEIESFEMCSVLYPNTQVVSSIVKNWTKNDRIRRIAVSVSVAYGSDTKLVESVLLECALNDESILVNPAPYVIFTELADSGLKFNLMCYLKDLGSVFTTGNALRHKVLEVLASKGISIPFPQTDVHFDKEIMDNLTKKDL